MYLWTQDKYSSPSFEQRLSAAGKNGFNITKMKSPKNEWHCGAVVNELLARENKPGSTPGDAVFCFFFCLIFVF